MKKYKEEKEKVSQKSKKQKSRIYKMRNLTIFLFIINIAVIAPPSFAQSFYEAKNILKKLYKQNPVTFYCGCDIEWQSAKKLIPNLASCGYKNRKVGQLNRAQRIEFEHVVPAYEFGHQRKCWQSGGRSNCTKTDKLFNVMEGDLHNLVPSVGEVNADRSNYRYAMIEGERRIYGACDAEVDTKKRTFEPTEAIRGDIARVYFYFEKQYGLRISNKQRQLFQVWDKQDKVDSGECAMERLKAIAQGVSNTFVSSHCQ